VHLYLAAMTTPTFETLLVTLRDSVCWLEMNRPARKNAVNTVMYRELAEALQFAAESDAVHVLVLTGSPLSKPSEFYSSGNDLQNLLDGAAGGDGDMAQVAQRSCEQLVAFVDAFIDFPKALIAAVNGPAHGIAVTTALLADLVYLSASATFTTPFTRLGQNPEGCSSILFPAMLGQKANRMLLLGETLTAQEFVHTRAARFGPPLVDWPAAG
jgi:peroxisomal 3,2-trans-enoyl-CoA isomerase